jgi:hypothetical protein
MTPSGKIKRRLVRELAIKMQTAMPENWFNKARFEPFQIRYNRMKSALLSFQPLASIRNKD